MDSSSISSDSSTEDEAIVCIVHAQLELMRRHAESSHTRLTPPIRRIPIFSDREAAYNSLVEDYFADDCTFNEVQIRRRFRMSRELFLRIVNDFEREFPYFQQMRDARDKLGFTPLQKCTSVFRQLAYGTAYDSFDEYLKMSEKISQDTITKFCQGVIDLYEKRYLRNPTWSDIQRIYNVHESVQGFPDMLGSIDVTHWEWSNCLTAWHGQHQRGDHSHPTLSLQAVASYDLWIWHAFFGSAGANNDINVLDQSHAFNNIIDGVAPGSSIIANEVEYKYEYYLAYSIYKDYVVFLKSFTCPHDEKRKYFKTRQEAARKDIERAFGVLKKK